MLIAVISDTHRVAKYINIAKEYIKSADVLIHLGDNSEDIEELTKESIIVLEGKKIFITHGDLYGVKYSLTNLYYRAKEVEADIVLFGHTHEQIILNEDGIIFMNPGSISLPKLRGRHIGYIDMNNGKIKDVRLKEVKCL